MSDKVWVRAGSWLGGYRWLYVRGGVVIGKILPDDGAWAAYSGLKSEEFIDLGLAKAAVERWVAFRENTK